MQQNIRNATAEPDIIGALTHENDALRRKIDIVVGGQHKCLLTMITVAFAATGAYYSKSLITDPTARLNLLLFVSQFVVFIALVAEMMTALLAVLAGYVEAIEYYTNRHLPLNVCIFESFVVRKFMISHKCIVFWLTTALSLFPVLFLAFCVWICISSDAIRFGVVVTVEMVALITIVALLIPLRDRSSKSAKEEMANKRMEHDFGEAAAGGNLPEAFHP